jgi:hypothetical protein
MENQVELYQSQDGINLTIQFANETLWLSQGQLAALFERDQSVISKHIKNVFVEGELDRESNMQKMHIANSDKTLLQLMKLVYRQVILYAKGGKNYNQF